MTPVDRRRSRSRSLRSRSPSRRAPARARSRSPPSRSPRARSSGCAPRVHRPRARRPSRSTRLLARWRRPWRPTAPPVAACDAATPPSRASVHATAHRASRVAERLDRDAVHARDARARVYLDLARVRRAVVCRPVSRRVCEPFAVVKPPRTLFTFFRHRQTVDIERPIERPVETHRDDPARRVDRSRSTGIARERSRARRVESSSVEDARRGATVAEGR